MIRQAISPRLAIRIRLNIQGLVWRLRSELFSPLAAGRKLSCQSSRFAQQKSSRRNGAFERFASLHGSPHKPIFRQQTDLFGRQDFTNRRRIGMALAIGDTAPDFEAETTEGKIRFHDWLGSSWGVLFSHPKDFTPVCTTELGTMARLKPEFDKRNAKIIGLSVDPVENHKKWGADIKDVVGFAPNYPMIGDTDLKISKSYG